MKGDSGKNGNGENSDICFTTAILRSKISEKHR